MIGEILVQNELQKSLEHFLMVIGGYSYSRRSLDDVELLSLDPTAYPVPDCLTQLNPLPVPIRAAGGALDYSSIYFNGTYYGKHKCLYMYWEVQLDFTPKIEVFHMLFKDVIIKIDLSNTI